MNFNNGPPYNNPAYNTQFGAYASVFPGMVPPMTVAPGMPPVVPGMPVAYPPGQGPLADKPAQRGANGLFEAPELDGPEKHEALQYVKLNPGEEVKYGEYWSQAVGEEDRVGGKEAVAFLGRAKKVSKGQLRRIWDIADHNKEGLLGRDEFYIALRLVALAQRGAELSVQGLRNFTGIQLIPDIAPEEKEEPRDEPNKPDIFSWTVSKDDIAKYDALFQKLDSKNMGMIDGKQGVTFFGKSGLPRPTLKKIWGLADVTRDGMLSLDEFRIAMHVVTNMLSKKLTVTALPSTMDPSGPNWLRVEGEEDSSNLHVNQESSEVMGATGAIATPPISGPQPQSPEAATILAPPPPQEAQPVLHSPPQHPVVQLQAPSPVHQSSVQTHQSSPEQDEAERMREALRKERLEVALQKERLEVERARREMEEMRAEMERLRLEKESLASATAQMSAPILSQSVPQAPLPLSRPIYSQSQSPGTGPISGPAPTPGTGAIVAGSTSSLAPISKPTALERPSLEGAGAQQSRGLSEADTMGSERINAKDDDEDIWDQPSPKASSLSGPNANATMGNKPIGSRDSVSSDDDDFWGGLGAKPTLGPAGGQKPGEAKGGFGGSELDDWVF